MKSRIGGGNDGRRKIPKTKKPGFPFFLGKREKRVSHIPTARLRSRGKVENQKQVSHFSIAARDDHSCSLSENQKPKKGSRPLRGLLILLSFSPPGGSVRVAASRQGGRAVVTVEDDGPGIPPAKLEAIFDRFYSERPSGEAFGTHSGLGLSISKQIVETLDGQIYAANRAGADGQVAGARFVVELPLA